MLIIERRICALLRYRKVYFPNREEALRMIRSVLPNEVIRLFSVYSDLDPVPHFVKHQQFLTVWVDLSAGPAAILNGMKRKSCRYEIRRAEKLLERIAIETNSPSAMRDFCLVYNSFAETKGPVPRLAARKLREYSTHSEVLVLYLDGRPLCCHLVLCDPDAGVVKLLYSGSRRLQSPEEGLACGALNRYLHWYEMQRYHARGFVTYDFGGIRHPMHPTARFKLSFGGTVVPEHYYIFGGTPWLASFGNFVYEKVFRRQMIAPTSKNTSPGAAVDRIPDTRENVRPCSAE